ncbi:MAG TPA: right-handed parallel beta-helix repeat-containing protein [Actinospica sp.]|nr:right-handed parallel beta-helix repeat-containing protein [Actinospica sp.]
MKTSTKAEANSTFSTWGSRTFSTPVSDSRRIESVATPSRSAVAARSAASNVVATSGTTIYATTSGTCSTETGTGTQAAPYCKLQDAVNAASPGDTIDVSGTSGESSSDSVTVKTSNISIVGVGGHAAIATGGYIPSALTLDDVTGVTVSGMMFTSDGDPAVQVIGSSDVTFTADYMAAAIGISPNDALTIDGTSSNVSVTRSVIDNGYGIGGSAVLISSGASAVTLAADVVLAGGITATGVSGLDVTGNTIQRSCGSGIDVEGTSTGVYLENNVLEDGNGETGTNGGGGSAANPEYCKISGMPWQPDVTVAAGSSTGVTSDYNDFYLGTDGTDPYSWGGTTYATLAPFQAAADEGAHDAIDTLETGLVDIWPAVNVWVNAAPVWDSAAIGSANVSAPSAQTTDFYGVKPFNTRGAIQYVSPDPTLAIGVTAETTAFGVTLKPQLTSASGVNLTSTTAWGDGTTTSVPMLGGGTNNQIPRHSYKSLGAYQVTVTVTDNLGDTATNSLHIETAGSEYTAFGPTRILDTRSGIGTNGSTSPLTSAAALPMRVAGADGIPSDIVAVALNLTLTNATGYGNVRAYPAGLTAPNVSNLNYSTGQTVANAVIVPVGAGGVVDLAKQGPGSVAMIADVTGYFTTADANGYTTMSPTRVLDTRYGTGGVDTPLTSAAPITLNVTGADGVPSGISAVAVNVTITNATGFGNIAAFPAGQTAPGTSTVNYSAKQTIANAAIVPVNANGQIELAKQGPGSVAVIVDVEGYFQAGSGSAYVPVVPTRIIDTRGGGALLANYYISAPMNQDSVPGITGFVLNCTVTNVTGSGFLTVFPDNGDAMNGGATPPNASNLNFSAGATVPNLTFATIGSNTFIDFYNGSRTGSFDLIVDAFGVFGDA